MSPIRTAVLPVAGLGTRFLPATKCVPKEMLPLLDRPCIDYIITEAVEAGIENIVLVTSRGKDALVDFFDRKPALEAHLERTGKLELLDRVLETARRAEVVSVRQQVALGLGHAVLTARPAVGNQPFAVLLGDDIIVSDKPVIGEMMAAYDADTQAAVVALMEVPQDQTDRYGICAGDWLPNGEMSVSHMVEKPRPADAPSRHAIVGRYVLPPDIFDILKVTRPGRGDEIQLTDALADLASQQRVRGFVFDGERHDTGSVLGLLRASMFLAARRPDLRDGFAAILEELSAL
ncbi:MAG: UTP--glucose-1-phosphate uridylyltransferase [Myxococcota bacterium]|jgi:UTP--glucose-1-phosphate uridylyltransferase